MKQFLRVQERSQAPQSAMKVTAVTSLAILLVLVSACTCAPSAGDGGAMFIPTPEMIKAFIPTPEEIAALAALHTTPAPGASPPPPPTGPPTMPPAVAALIEKYKKAVAAFYPSTPMS
ncbi:uncharacterized protein [Macrobrachium rosenbergii]|uniref:uncharacterized protein isoform X2 n=1 Tax=Macrobrachium rosenbergii TaxID=79674 RepID=UPI0034D4DDEE